MMGVLTGLATLAAVVYSWLTWRLLNETTLLRRAQTEPAISLHLEVGRHLNLLNLVIQNHGQGTAYDLTWKVSPSPKDLERHRAELGLKLLDGFSHLAPGQRIVHFFGSAMELLSCPPVTITVACRDTARRPLAPMTFVLHPAQFAGILQCGEAIEESVANSLEKIAKTLDRITSAGNVRITTVDGKPWLRHLHDAREKLGEEIQREATARAEQGAPADAVAAQASVAQAAVAPAAGPALVNAPHETPEPVQPKIAS